MLTKEEAKKWAQSMCEDGTGKVRKAYLEQFGVGKIAKAFWDDEKFCLGIEYGILIAVAKIYGNLQETDHDYQTNEIIETSDVPEVELKFEKITPKSYATAFGITLADNER